MHRGTPLLGGRYSLLIEGNAMVTDAFADEFYSSIIESLPEAVIVSTLEGQIVYVNLSLEKLLGYSAHELKGKPISKLVPQQPGRRADQEE